MFYMQMFAHKKNEKYIIYIYKIHIKMINIYPISGNSNNDAVHFFVKILKIYFFINL